VILLITRGLQVSFIRLYIDYSFYLIYFLLVIIAKNHAYAVYVNIGVGQTRSCYIFLK